jgi:hypothetical protein
LRSAHDRYACAAQPTGLRGREVLSMLDYPKVFTDPEWKKLEKVLKISDTGVGKTLRDLQKAHTNADKGVQALSLKKAPAEKVQPAVNAARVAAKKASDTVRATSGKVKDPKAQKELDNLVWQLNRYELRLKSFDLKDHHGLKWVVDNFNDDMKWLATKH